MKALIYKITCLYNFIQQLYCWFEKLDYVSELYWIIVLNWKHQS